MDTQQLYMEYRGMSEQLQKVQQFLEQTTENIGELSNVIEAVAELGKLKKGDRLFAPLANGIFVDATLNDPTTLRMNVGGKVVVSRTIDEATALLMKQKKELEELRDRATTDSIKITERLRQIESAIENSQEE
jgi:prefoldin alpha subunit